MRGYHLTTVWGIPIRINASLLVVLPILAWLIGSGAQIELYTFLVNEIAGTALDAAVLQQGATPWLIGGAAAVGLFVSVTLHELGHAYVALRYDLEVESITLWILGGLASLREMPREWNREFWIAIAGPFVSIVTGLVCIGALFVLPASAPATTFVVGWLGVTNLFLAVFNLLPAFPMDGGRVLRAVLARRRPYAEATRLAARVGAGFAVLFAIVGVLQFSPILLLLAWFIYSAATSESRYVLVGELLSDLTVSDILDTGMPAVEADATVAELVDRLFAERVTAVAVVEDGTVVGVVTVEDFKALSAAERADTRVATLARRDLPRIAADTAAFDALATLDGQRATAAIVDGVDGPQIVTRADFASALEMRRLVGGGEPF